MNSLSYRAPVLAEYVETLTQPLQPAWQFDTYCAPDAAAPSISTGLPLLAGTTTIEQLYLPQPLKIVQGDGHKFFIGERDGLLVVWADTATTQDFSAQSRALYQTLLDAMQAQGFSHLVRVWNYFADINGEEAGLERYRHFCRGRFEALREFGIDDAQFPSACALGHQGGALLIYALVSQRAPRHYENPQQLAAYEYPASYGPRSPSFARASVHQWRDTERYLFLSGTASVLGHQTVCVDDIDGQVRTTLENIATLLTSVAQQEARIDTPVTAPAKPWQPVLLKIYVRHPAHLAQVQAQLEVAFADVPKVYVQADVCRADLLFEMDGIWKREH